VGLGFSQYRKLAYEVMDKWSLSPFHNWCGINHNNKCMHGDLFRRLIMKLLSKMIWLVDCMLLGDKINSEDMWILTLSHLVLHLGHSSWPCIEGLFQYDNTSDLPNSATMRNIPRSPSMIGANISRIFTPRRNIPRSPCMIEANMSRIFMSWRIGRSTLQPSRRYLLKLD